MRNAASKIESKLTLKLHDEMYALEARLQANPEGDPLIWVMPDQLACTRRPLRDHPDFEAYVYEDYLPAEAGPLVIAWVERIVAAGICSVICLLPDGQLRRYTGLRGMTDGLLSLYEKRGLEVRRVACSDPRHEHVEKGWLKAIKPRAYAAFVESPKPVLLHCSAGIDRSSQVAAHIMCRLREASLGMTGGGASEGCKGRTIQCLRTGAKGQA